MNILQIKPQAENVDINFYDLYHTGIKNRDDKEIVNDQYEDKEKDYIINEDFITLNHFIG